MGLITKAFIIFLTIIFLIMIVASNPTPALIGVTVIGGSVLIAWQTIVILKDEKDDARDEAGTDKTINHYLKK